MVLITPGIDLLSRTFLSLSAFISLVISLNHFSSKFPSTSHTYPLWAVLTATITSIPLSFGAYNLYQTFKKKRLARKMGARMVPVAQGVYPGNVDILQRMIENLKKGYPGDGLDELLEKKGNTVNLRVLWSDMLFTTNPEHIKTILATDFHNYVKGKRFHYNMGAVLGTGVFNSDGEMWKFHRSITRPMFTRERISHFELFDRKTNIAISKLKERLREGHAVDFQDVMSRFTLDSATEFLFGTSVESLSAGLPYPHTSTAPPLSVNGTSPGISSTRGEAANQFAHAFLKAQEVISVRERMGWAWPLLDIFEDKAVEPMRVVNAYIEPIVQDALRKRREEKARGEKVREREGGVQDDKEVQDEDTLLDYLVRMTEDPVVLKDEILNIMIAGRDTTAATLTYIFYFLAMYPNIMTRLREEIISKVGYSRRPDYDDIREMKYLRAVINETLRLYPIVPFNIRESVNDTTWVSEDPNEKPFFIPAGTKTSYSVLMMHRRKDLWGPDAEEFDPDRFIDERLKKYLSKNPFIFLPFNAGPRICLGQQFAYNEMSFMIIRLLQNFSSISLDLASLPTHAHPPAEWAQATGRKAVEKVWPKMHLTLYAEGGLWLKMQESDETN